MRITVDFSSDQLAELDRASRREGRSRQDLIRAAITAYLAADRRGTSQSAFGLWADRGLDGLVYQERLREEWADREGSDP